MDSMMAVEVHEKMKRLQLLQDVQPLLSLKEGADVLLPPNPMVATRNRV